MGKTTNKHKIYCNTPGIMMILLIETPRMRRGVSWDPVAEWLGAAPAKSVTPVRVWPGSRFYLSIGAGRVPVLFLCVNLCRMIRLA